MNKLNWIDLIVERLRDYPEGEIWTDGGSEILVKTESAANTIADLFELLYKVQGEDIEINTGYYDPEEDKRNNKEDRYTGWWYVYIE